MRVKDASEWTGVPVRIITHWIELGIIEVEKQGKGRPRVLSDKDVGTISVLASLRKKGLKFAGWRAVNKDPNFIEQWKGSIDERSVAHGS